MADVYDPSLIGEMLSMVDMNSSAIQHGIK